MSKTPFQTFIDLVALDQHIRTLHKECEHRAQQLMQISDSKKSLYDRLDYFKQNVYQAKKMVDSYELEMKTLDEQEKDKKKRLDQITNLKEYNSIKSELDMIHEQQGIKEQDVLDAWHALDSAQDQYARYQKEFDEQINQLDKQIETYTKQHTDCIQKVEEQQQMRPEHEKGVPQEWLEKYMLMRSQVADPVVPLQDDSCSACFYTATKQDSILIKRGSLIQCKSCYRLLYAPERI